MKNSDDQDPFDPEMRAFRDTADRWRNSGEGLNYGILKNKGVDKIGRIRNFTAYFLGTCTIIALAAIFCPDTYKQPESENTQSQKIGYSPNPADGFTKDAWKIGKVPIDGEPGHNAAVAINDNFAAEDNAPPSKSPIMPPIPNFLEGILEESISPGIKSPKTPAEQIHEKPKPSQKGVFDPNSTDLPKSETLPDDRKDTKEKKENEKEEREKDPKDKQDETNKNKSCVLLADIKKMWIQDYIPRILYGKKNIHTCWESKYGISFHKMEEQMQEGRWSIDASNPNHDKYCENIFYLFGRDLQKPRKGAKDSLDSALDAVGWWQMMVEKYGNKSTQMRRDCFWNMAAMLLSIGESYGKNKETENAIAAYSKARESFRQYGLFYRSPRANKLVAGLSIKILQIGKGND